MNIPCVRILAFAGMLTCATGAQAATILTLVDVPEGDEIQQTLNSPCVFGDASCDAGALGTYTQFPTGPQSEYLESQSYTVGDVVDAVGETFDIGIDVNTTSAESEVLDYFNIYIDDVLFWSYDGDDNIAQAVDLKNGTGWSDWVLTSVDLTGLDPDSEITFEVHVLDPVDGREQFFLIPTDGPPPPTPIPEPASLILFGTGLAGAAASARKRLKKS